MPRSQVEAQTAAAGTPSRKPFPTVKRLVWLVVLVALIVGLLWLLSHSGSFLVINAPERSDVMVVLAGGEGSSRFAQAIRLQKMGYAPVILIDADVSRDFYGKSEADLVRDYLNRTPSLRNAQVCPTMADSTYGEVVDVERCLKQAHAASAIVVTSDFHTRRALSIFRGRLPQYQWSVAASSWPASAAEQWWKHRWWAKTVIDEWEKYLWWELVDRWRSGLVLS
ncbi:MAG TPA: YdcF family protein [Verrucomicrobiae bacterium]|jgi:uncharacterized SAM-binding protein YcdF (DUF218 family)|nr:YdcF family protein [Verrucomicrobiae bacterium]